jgi:L-threonylcarbamoyladenylate synthase
VRTKTWRKGLNVAAADDATASLVSNPGDSKAASSAGFSNSISKVQVPDIPHRTVEMLDLPLGSDSHSIARGLFSALRSLDERNVSVIYVEGISDQEGDLAAAIMNRLRKAAEEEVKT